MTTAQVQPNPVEAALSEIAALVAERRYGSFALRLEILKPNRFVTGMLEFHDEIVDESKQELFDYADVMLASFTCHVDMWHDFARRLISGKLEVFGVQITSVFSFGSRQEELYLSEGSNRPRECFQFVGSAAEALHSARPLLGVSLPPYANLADASARYVHQSIVAHTHIPNANIFVIAIPLRPEIALAEWLPGEVRIRLFKDALPGHQLDLLFWEPIRVTTSRSITDPTREINIPVPPGTKTVVGHLLAPSGSVVQSFVLNTPYTFVGEAKSSLSHEQQVRADIRAGESENREMKTFFNPDQNKDMRDRVLDSAIAFANTSGGHIYVGVEDHGELSGNSRLVSTMKSGTPEACAQELSTKLRKQLIEDTRPVIEVSASPVKIGSEWVVLLSVQQSQQIVSTHTNDVFIRSGASNRKPQPEWFTQRQQMFR